MDDDSELINFFDADDVELESARQLVDRLVDDADDFDSVEEFRDYLIMLSGTLEQLQEGS